MKNKLIYKCRYYKGENICPESIAKAGKSILWFYEMKWVEDFGGKYEDWNGEYIGSGLANFEKEDGVDITIKMLLFNRYIQDSSLSSAIEPFKEWYLKFYMGIVLQ
jgi:hypothetical protein